MLLVDTINYLLAGVAADQCEMSLADFEFIPFATVVDIKIGPNES